MNGFLAYRLLRDGGRIVIEDTDELRKKEGISYTPANIIDYLRYKSGSASSRCSTPRLRAWSRKRNFTRRRRQNPRAAPRSSLDPAMGFRLVSAAAFRLHRRRLRRYNAANALRNGLRAAGEPPTLPQACSTSMRKSRRRFSTSPPAMLLDNIFGVDLDPQAVELAWMSLWLRAGTRPLSLPANKCEATAAGKRP